MIYISAIYATADESMVTGTDANGATETVPADYTLFRQPEHGPLGYLASGNTIAPYVAPPAPSPFTPLAPYQFWTAVRATGQEAMLRDWAAALENPLEKAAATSMLEFSLEYCFDHPFMEAARQAINLPLSEFESLWLWATTL